MEFWYKITDRDIVDSVPHIVYDMSIEDLNSRRLKAKVFDNVLQTAAFLGVTVDHVFRNRKPKKYIKAIDDKTYSVRLL
jgi:hypothetical protein